MAEERIYTVNYDLEWTNVSLTADCDRAERFYPLNGKIPEINPDSKKQKYNPQFCIYLQNRTNSYNSREKYVDCFLEIADVIPKDLSVKSEIIIESSSIDRVKLAAVKCVFNNTPIRVKLFTVVIQDKTLRVSGKIIPFSRHQDFVALKCHFKISYKDPVVPEVAPTLNMSRGKCCCLCFDYKNLYDSKEMADVTFIVGDDDSILAHKLVLATRSPVFKAMLTTDCLESNSKIIQISDTDVSAFEYFLKYLYYGEIGDKSFDAVCILYGLADKYAVDGLKEECRKILLTELKIDTACQLLEMSHLFTDKALKKKAVEFIKKHFSTVSNRPEWLKVCKDNPELASEVLRMVTLHYR